MSVRLKLVLVAAVAALSLAAFAGSASAQLYCVGVTTCAYGGETGINDQYALADVPYYSSQVSTDDHDTLMIGDGGSPYSQAIGGSNPTKTLDVIAEPGSHPVLKPTPSLSTVSIHSAHGCRISGLEIEVPDQINGTALYTNCNVSDVEISGTTAAVETRGLYVQSAADSVISNLDVVWDAGSKGTAVTVANDATVDILDTTINGNILNGINATSSPGSDVQLWRTKITTVGPAIQNGGASGSLSAFGVLARSTSQPEGAGVVSLTNGATFFGKHITIIGSGGQYRFGLLGRANSGSLSGELTNSIITSTGADFDFAVFGEETGAAPYAAIQLFNSIATTSFGDDVVRNTPVVPGIGEPKFVGANDFRLKPNQAAIDKSTGIDSDTVDANGEGRAVDGDDNGSAISDLGAFEYQRRAPDTDVLGPTSLAPGQEGEFDAQGTFDADGDDMTYEWDFGDGSPVDTSGLVVHHAYAAGKFQLKFTATDESGESDTTTLDIDVPAPFVPPVVIPVVPETPKDITAPIVSIGKVKPNKKGTSLSTRVTCPPTETTCKFTLGYTARQGKTGKAKRMAKDVTATVAGGQSVTLTLKLNSAALKLIKSKGKVKGTITLTATDGASNSAYKKIQYTAKQGKTGSAK